MNTVRDRFWLWGHAAGSHGKSWGLPTPSRMTPAEAALYMGVPNVIMVRYDGRPAPPLTQYAVPFRALKQVVWSVVGASGTTEARERSQVIELARELSNMTGVMMDDFFRASPADGEVGALSLDELQALRNPLSLPERRLDLWVVLYGHQLSLPVRDHLELCDKVTFWTWKAEDLEHLERDFEAVEALAQSCGKVLGCYMWDYGTKQPMPVEWMKRQCETGLRWLREGRIEGMIFLASCICDLDLEAVEWTRRWIAEVGDQAL